MLGTITIKVRPLKLALLVDPGNSSQIREAIRVASSLWGGTFFPIIPMYKRLPATWRNGTHKSPRAKDVVQGYIQAFDPDILVQFSTDLPPYIADSQITVITPQDLWASATAEDADPALGIGVLDLLSDIYDECFKYKAKYPKRIIIPTIPKKLGLFGASVFGEYPEHIFSAVNSHFSEALEIDRPEVVPAAFMDLTDQTTLFPRRITGWAVKQYGSLRFGRDACIYFMDAQSIEDVIDYWNLRATGRSVIPLPKQFLHEESFRKIVEEFLVQERRPWRHDPKMFDVASFIRSRSSTMEEMSAYVKTLDFPDRGLDESESSYLMLQDWYPRIWDQWARDRDGGIVDFYGPDEESIEIRSPSELEMRIRPIIPKFGRENWFRSEGLCANEFDLRMYGADEFLAEVYPRSQGQHLVRAISGITGTRGEWRIGRHGLVKIVKSLLDEPRKLPASEEIFFAWLKDHGWAAELSPPGILAKQIYKRLGGFVTLLANRSVLGLIEYMNGGSVNKDGTPIPGGKIGTEREVSVGEVKSRLQGKNARSAHYDFFIEKGVFKLGLRTKCPSCQRNTWFPLSSIRELLECPKCLNTFAAAGNIEQVKHAWHYRTAGPFSVPNFAEGAFSVLFTLHALSDRMLSSLRTTSIPSFVASSPGKENLEADLAIFWKEIGYGEESHGILFGECKTYGLFETKDVDRMRRLGETFPGAVLVFSTLRETLTKNETSALTRLAKAGRKYWKAEFPINPVLILTGTELLSWQRPPFCWHESHHKRFQHIHNLLALCDATQQLYLNLPPLHEDWRKRSEQRSNRRRKSG